MTTFYEFIIFSSSRTGRSDQGERAPAEDILFDQAAEVS
jgi:hypothetical protein